MFKHANKLWTKICEMSQNFKWDLTKFCEIFLNITLGLPQYSLKSFFFHDRSLWKPQQCVIYLYVYFLIKPVVKWSGNSVRFEFLWELPSRRAKFCAIWSHCVRYGMYECCLWNFVHRMLSIKVIMICSLMLNTLGKFFSRPKFWNIFSYFSKKTGVDISCKFAWNVNPDFWKK